MKSISIIFLALCVSSVAIAGPKIERSEFEETFTEYVECLGADVTAFIEVKAISREFVDGNDRNHWMLKHTYSGVYVSGEMSWIIPRGTFIGVQNGYWSYEEPFVNINETREVALANGDYPDLHFLHRFSGVINANGEIKSLRVVESEYRCVER